MGCASSKSTPVIDSISSGANDAKDGSNALFRKGKDAVKEVANDVNDIGHDISHKIGSLIGGSKSSQPSTPETERVQMPDDEATNSNDEENAEADAEADAEEDDSSSKVPMKILSIAVDEDNTDQLQDNQVPVKVSLSIGDPDDEAGGEKPPTPMPEAVINNAIWPHTLSEYRENESSNNEPETHSTPLDPIDEEKRFVDLPSSEGAATIEILTIEITEIPIVDDVADSTPDEQQEHTAEDQNEEKST